MIFPTKWCKYSKHDDWESCKLICFESWYDKKVEDNQKSALMGTARIFRQSSFFFKVFHFVHSWSGVYRLNLGLRWQCIGFIILAVQNFTIFCTSCILMLLGILLVYFFYLFLVQLECNYHHWFCYGLNAYILSITIFLNLASFSVVEKYYHYYYFLFFVFKGLSF